MNKMIDGEMVARKVDVLIIGGGIGGLTLAQWLTGLGRSWRIVEREAALGGPLADSQYILKWIPGQAEISGRDYLAAMVAQIDAAQCALNAQLNVVNVAADLSQGDFVCSLSNGELIHAKKLVFACGATPFSPFPESERVIVGAGLQKISHIAAGQRVAVLGGGDNAADHALILAEMGVAVTMLARGKLRVSAALVQQLHQNAAIVMKTECEEIELVATEDGVIAQGEHYDYAAVYFGYQASPQLNAFPVLKTAAGALREGAFAIGDMTQPEFPNILLTQGQAAVVAKQIDFELSHSAT
jgi:thioredoxin reductase